MAGRPRIEWVRPQGQFIGSTGMLFIEQTAADIYFSNYFHTPGNVANKRIAVVCTSWGMSMLYIQRGTRNGGQAWPPRTHLANLVVVQDHGVQPPNGIAMVPAHIQAVVAGSPGLHYINNRWVSGARLPWHRRVAVWRRDKKPLHYHQHEPRVGHIPEEVPPINEVDGSHVTFTTLVYGSQVSNYRRAEKKW